MATSTTPGSVGNIDVTGAQAVVEWSNSDSQASYLCSSGVESAEIGQTTFDCHFCPESSSASFRLRSSIQLKGFGRKAAPLFVFIAPERIRSLVCNGPEQLRVPAAVRKALGDGDIVSMRFVLSQPADLVVPPHSPFVPKKKIFWDIFDSLKMLAQEISFVVYLRREEGLFQGGCLEALCNMVSSGSLSTNPAHVNISRLYDGKGGKLLADAELSLAANVTAIVDSPPPYEDAGPPPPAPPLDTHIAKDPGLSIQDEVASCSRKRRRTSSTKGNTSTTSVSRHESSTDIARVEAICRKVMGEMDAKWKEEGDQLRTELREMETRMKGWVDERLNKHINEVREERRQASVQQHNQTEDHVQEVRPRVQEVRGSQGVDDRIEDVKTEVQALGDETSEIIDGKVDERLDILRTELEEYVTDQLHEAEDRVIDRLRSSVFIDFNIYE